MWLESFAAFLVFLLMPDGGREKIPLLLEGEERLHVAGVNAADEAEVGEVALLLFGLFGEDVALESVLSLDLS